MTMPRSQRRKGEAYEAYLPPGDQSRYFVLAYSVLLVSQAGKCVVPDRGIEVTSIIFE